MSRLTLVFGLLLGCVFAVSSQQRPLLTDDIDITPPGSLEISAGVDFYQRAKFPLSGINGDLIRVGDIRVKTGLAPNVEIQIEGTLQNYVGINSLGPSAIPLTVTGNSTNDFDDFIISAKIKLRNETRYVPAIGMKFGYQMPNTDQAKGIGTNQINIFSKIILQKRFARRANYSKFTAFGNIGLGIMTAPLERFTQNDVLLYGIAGNYRVNDSISVVGEVNGRANTRSGGAPLGTESLSQLRIGTQIRASGLMFDTAGIIGLTKQSPQSGFTFGITYVTPVILPPAK
jgi:hypothetical protein